MLVTRAAAKISRKRLADLVLAWVGILLEEDLDRRQDSRCAKSALQAVGFLEGFLDGVQVINRPQSFDGGDFMSVRLNGKHETGTNWFPIQ